MASSTIQKLPGLPTTLSPTEQLEALRRVQAQAEKRVKLGTELFRAAETQTTRQQTMIQQIKSEQESLRSELQEEVARSLNAYDQWMVKIDESFTHAMQSFEQKIASLDSHWHRTQEKIESMLNRSQALLDQSSCLLETSRATIAGQDQQRRPTRGQHSAGTAANKDLDALSVSPTKLDTNPGSISDTPPSDTDNLSYIQLIDQMNHP